MSSWSHFGKGFCNVVIAPSEASAASRARQPHAGTRIQIHKHTQTHGTWTYTYKYLQTQTCTDSRRHALSHIGRDGQTHAHAVFECLLLHCLACFALLLSIPNRRFPFQCQTRFQIPKKVNQITKKRHPLRCSLLIPSIYKGINRGRPDWPLKNSTLCRGNFVRN